MFETIPAWAARFFLYVIIGAGVIAGLPFFAWLGKREVQRWENKVESLENEIDRMQRERRREHTEVEHKLDQVLEEVQS